MRNHTIFVTVLVIAAFIRAFSSLGQDRRLAPLVDVQIATNGPCWGQDDIASLRGMDIISAERARALAAAHGLGVCVDVVHPSGEYPYACLEVFAWPKQASKTAQILFSDIEFSLEATMRPASPPSSICDLPEPFWIGKSPASVKPLLPKRVVEMIENAVSTPQYRAIALSRTPTVVAVAERKALPVWGNCRPYDLYVRFGKEEFHKFEFVPTLGLIYAGRMDPVLLPWRLDPFNLHL